LYTVVDNFCFFYGIACKAASYDYHIKINSSKIKPTVTFKGE